jgi:hypothetical protein
MDKLVNKRAQLVAEMRSLLDGKEGLNTEDQEKLAKI